MNTNENMNEKVKQKGKSKVKGCVLVLLIILVLLAVGGGIGWTFISKEHREAASLPLNAVDFDKLNDGTYHGMYAGGMYRWRANDSLLLKVPKGGSRLAPGPRTSFPWLNKTL